MESRSLQPICDSRTRILILGTLPGAESLRTHRYYANPRNQFWSLIFGVFQYPIPASYEEKIDFLLDKGIGLWDVIAHGHRPGSLDSAISEEVPNDLESFFREHPRLVLIGLNGRKAERLFRKYGESAIPGIPVYPLPSSSPTPGRHTKSLEQKLEAWQTFFSLPE